MPTKLITGQPGNGKTLYAVSLILEALKTGRPVYSNINGLNIDGVEPIPVNAKGELDWTMTEAGDEEAKTFGALVIYDETQKLPYFAYKAKEKLSSNPLITKLEDHRHFAYDLIFITQSPKFLHLHLLELINEHYHVKRPMNRARAEIHKHRGYSMNPETVAAQERAEDIFKFDYPKDLFKLYKSTEIVTNSKIQIPKYMKKLFFIVGFCAIGIIYMIFFSDNKIFNHVKGTDKASIQPSSQATQDVSKTALNALATMGQFDPNVECRKAVNLDKPECVKWFDDLSKNKSSVMSTGQVVQTVSYNPDKPYDFEYQPQVQPTDFPQMSGVLRLRNGRLMAVDQQGNYMTSVSQSDCKKWLSGYRPFNYFKQQQASQEKTVQQQDVNKDVEASSKEAQTSSTSGDLKTLNTQTLTHRKEVTNETNVL